MINRGDRIAEALRGVVQGLREASPIVTGMQAGIEPTDEQVLQIARAWEAAHAALGVMVGEAYCEVSERQQARRPS